MKKILILTIALSLVVAGIAFAGLAGTKHDFTLSGSGTWTGNTGGICQPCHTPHNGDPYNQVNNTAAPLWNHSASVEAGYTPYARAASIDASDIDADLGAASLMCMGCHDGTVTLEEFGGATSGATTISGDGALGTNLADDHPIGFTYDNALVSADGQLDTVANVSSLLVGAGSDQVECTSCHNVHDTTNMPFLVMDNSTSELCLSCHLK